MLKSICVMPAGCVLAILSVDFAALPAQAALSVEVRLVPQQSSVAVDDVLGIDVFLRNLTDTNTSAPARVVGVDLDFGGVTTTTSPLRFTATAGAPNAFVPASTFSAALPLAIDGSLVDGHISGLADLSYTTAFPTPASSGLASNGPDVFVGTLYLSSVATGDYTLSVNHGATLVQSDNSNFDPFVPTFSDAAFTVTNVPEPAAGLTLLTGAAVLLRKRRRT